MSSLAKPRGAQSSVPDHSNGSIDILLSACKQVRERAGMSSEQKRFSFPLRTGQERLNKTTAIVELSTGAHQKLYVTI